MSIRNQQDFAAGCLFVAIGASFAFLASSYPLGTFANMGAGAVPLALGLVVVILGLGVLARSVASGAARVALPRFAWQTLVYVCVPVVLFGLLISRLGIAGCVLLVVVLSSLARKDFSIWSTLAVATVLIAASIGLFVLALGMVIPAWPTFLHR